MVRRIALFVIVCLCMTGCGQPPPSTTLNGTASPTGGSGTITPVFAFTEVVVGRNRIAMGLLRNGTPLNEPDAIVHLRFTDLTDTAAPVKSETDAIYYGQGLPAGIYVAYPTFETAGNWGVEVTTQLPGEAPTSSKLRLEVKPSSDVPNVGQPAISTKTLTVHDVPDPVQLSSDSHVDLALYQISLDQALTSGKPTALLFATPAFCQTATCSPSLKVIEGLQQTYGDRMNFIHVEVYAYPFEQSVQRQAAALARATKEYRALTPEEQRAGLADAMVAWRLQSEPWLFLIDAHGTIAARFEGGITKEELAPALQNLIAGKPVVVGSEK